MPNGAKQLAGSSMPFLEQISGDDKGRVFEISRRRLTIGRGEENDVVVTADGVSRNHAIIDMAPDGTYMIRDNGSKNGVQVNGTSVETSPLQHGDVVRIANCVFRFGDESAVELQDAGPSNGGMNAGMEMADYSPAVENSGAPARRGKPNKRLLIYGGVGLVLAFVMMSGSEEKQEAEGEQTEVAERFKVSGEPDLSTAGIKPAQPGLEDPLLKQAEQELAKMDWSNSSLREAEQFFRKGQREYYNGNFQRSIDFFEAALNIYRTHPLAQLYLARAKSESEQSAKRNFEMGIRYFESLQYTRAIYHFEQVVSQLAHRPDEKVIGESEKYIAVAKKRLQAAEMFP